MMDAERESQVSAADAKIRKANETIQESKMARYGAVEKERALLKEAGLKGKALPELLESLAASAPMIADDINCTPREPSV